MEYVKTKNSIVIRTKDGSSEVLYFRIIADWRDKIAENGIGIRGYVIQVYIMRNSVLVPAEKEYPEISPIKETYKCPYWDSLFGNMTSLQIDANESNLMISQFDHNKEKYWGLTANDYEIVNI